jgi:nucleoside-diphosphate kinase
MAVERTLCILKPNAVERRLVGAILRLVEESGLRIAALRAIRLSQAQAMAFYDVHRERPFYARLVAFMSSGPVVVAVLEGEDAVARHRALMGATDPDRAAPGTIRALYGESTERNAVHGSDAPDTARREIAFFFPEAELV